MVGYNGYDATHAYVIYDMSVRLLFRNAKDALGYCILNGLTCPIIYELVRWEAGAVR